MSEIKPALTVEEWEHREFAVGEAPSRDKQGHMLFGYISDTTGELFLGWNGVEMHAVKNAAPLAALALYDQPFGFTREDVEELRRVTKATEWSDGGSWDFSDLADRIEALLPPEKP